MPRAPANLWSSNKISFSERRIESSLLSHSWGGVFYHPAFISAASGALGLVDAPIIIESENEIIGAANLLHRKHRIFHTATIPLLFQYYGPLLFAGCGDELLPDFESYISNQFDFAYLSLPPGTKLSNLSNKWRILPQITPAILSGDLKTWGNKFRDDVKNKIRKARRGYTEICAGDSLPVAIWQQTFNRRRMPTPIPPDALKIWCDALIKASLLRIYLAKKGGETISFRGELVFGGFAYDWLAGSDPHYHTTGANQLLMAEIGRELAAMNLDAWDLVGGQVKAIDDFKKSFGAEGIPHFHAIKAFNIKGRLFESLRKLRHG